MQSFSACGRVPAKNIRPGKGGNEGDIVDAAELIRKAKAEGRTALTEAESKEVLRQFGVPAVAESVAATPEEAVAKAQAIGFPVVLKGLGTKLTHKTERGLVRLNLKDDGEVRQAASAVVASAGADLEG